MAKYFTVAENGQVEINWMELEVLEEEHVKMIDQYLNGFYTMGHTMTSIEDSLYSVDFYLSNESYFQGSLMLGTYVILSYNKFDGACSITNLSHNDLKHLGYLKGGMN